MKPDYSFYVALGYISFLSIIIPLLIGTIARKKLEKNEMLIFILLIISSISELLIYILFKYKMNNLFVSRIQGITELTFLSFFFIEILAREKVVFFIRIGIGVFIALAAFDLYLHGFNSIDNISLTTECILLMLYALITFFHLIKTPVHDNILAVPLFWFNTAILTYFSGNLFLFVFSNYIEKHFAMVSPALWGIHSLLNIVFYLLLSVGFCKTAVKPI